MAAWRRRLVLLGLLVLSLAGGCGGHSRLLSPPGRLVAAGRAASLYGDLNGNGRVDAADATKVLRVVVGLDATPADLATMDFNGNGLVDAADATKVLRVVVALDPALSVVAPTKALQVDARHGAVRGSVQKKLRGRATTVLDAEAPTVWVTSGGHLFFQRAEPAASGRETAPGFQYGFGYLAPVAALPISAAAPGYGQASVTAPVVAGEVQVAPPLSLTADPSDTTGRIHGIVFDALGKPVKGAVVGIVSAGYVYTTDTDGYYVFIGLQPGSYDLSCQAAGESPTASCAVAASETAQVDFHLGDVAKQPRVSATVRSSGTDPGVGMIGSTFTFTGNATPGVPGVQLTYQWTFGDGATSAASRYNADATHGYTQAGNFIATLTVTDSAGHVGTAWQQVTVLSLPAVQVTLEPPGAAAAGARWQVDADSALLASGEVRTVGAGDHTVHCTAASGYETPADQTVTAVAGQTVRLTVTYAARPGTLTVRLTPAEAVTAGARWRLDGDSGHLSGETVSGVPAGSHLLTFSAVSGFTKPVDQIVAVGPGAATTASAAYLPLPGTVRVNILPAAAVAAGARWTLDQEGVQRATGEVSGTIPGGEHVVHGAPVAGWFVQDVSVAVAGRSVSTNIVYSRWQHRIAGTFNSAVVLKSDGVAVYWRVGEAVILPNPTGLGTVVGVAAGFGYLLALRADGSVTTWGPGTPAQPPAGLSGVVAIDANSESGEYSLALRSDGTIVAWGANNAGQCDVPRDLSGVVAIAAGGSHCLAVRADGTVVAWGDNTYGQCNVPPGLAGVVQVAASVTHSLALTADGQVRAWGNNHSGVLDVPMGLPSIARVYAGYGTSVALCSDGTTISWPSGAVAAGWGQVVDVGLHLVPIPAYWLALRADDTVVGTLSVPPELAPLPRRRW